MKSFCNNTRSTSVERTDQSPRSSSVPGDGGEGPKPSGEATANITRACYRFATGSVETRCYATPLTAADGDVVRPPESSQKRIVDRRRSSTARCSAIAYEIDPGSDVSVHAERSHGHQKDVCANPPRATDDGFKECSADRPAAAKNTRHGAAAANASWFTLDARSRSIRRCWP
jgi:hypothetical protein